MKKKLSLILLAIFALFSFASQQTILASQQYTYNSPASESLDLSSIPKTVYVGEKGTIFPDKNGILQGASYAFRYRVSDPSLFSIMDNGFWEARQPGTVTLSIRMTNKDEDPRFEQELRDRGLVPGDVEPLVYHSPYQATITIVPADFQPVYRLYNRVSKAHLYTTDANEKAVLSAQKDWTYEGLAWKSSWQDQSQGQPVYRLYNHALGKHLYTKDQNEVTVLGGRDWKNEGISYYSDGNTPIYRLYLEGLQKHHYTADQNEVQVLKSKGWRYEGMAWYSLP